MKVSAVTFGDFSKTKAFSIKEKDTSVKEKSSFEFPNYKFYNSSFYGAKYSPVSKYSPNYDVLNCDYSNLDEFCNTFSQKINSQMQVPAYYSVRSLIQKLKSETGASEQLIKEVLYNTTLYCGYEAIEELSYIIQKEKASAFGMLPRELWGYHDFSTNASLDYLLFSKKMCSNEPQESDKSIVILDSNFISRLEMFKKEKSKYYDEFIKKAKRGDVVVCNLKGWDIKCGDDKYLSANFLLGTGFLYDISKSVIKRLQKGEKLDDILYKDLEDDFRCVAGNDIKVKRKSPMREKVVGLKTTRDILENIKRPEVSKEQLKNVIEKYSKIVGGEDKDRLSIALCKYLDECSVTYSPETFCSELKTMERKINSFFLNGKKPLYYVPHHSKSYGHIMNLYSRINGVAPEDIFGCSVDDLAKIKDDLADERLVVIDDISASAKSLYTNLKFIHKDDCEDIKVLSSTILMSDFAKSFLETSLKSENETNEMLYMNKIKDINYGKKDKEFELLDKDDLKLVRGKIYTGFGGVGISCAFPHIIPDNSSDISGIIFNDILYKSTENSNKAVYSPPNERIEDILKEVKLFRA